MLQGCLHRVTAWVSADDNLLYGKHYYKAEVLADFDEHGEELVITHKYPQGLRPGVHAGGMPILKRSDLLRPRKPQPDVRELFPGCSLVSLDAVASGRVRLGDD